jgi:membrane fusion protein, heavy metal efflux system
MNRRILAFVLILPAFFVPDCLPGRFVRQGDFEAQAQARPDPGKHIRRNGADESSFAGSWQVVIPPDSPQLALLKISEVRLADIPGHEVTAPGRIEFDPNRISRILSPVPGRINQVLVRLGDSVAAGQPLLTVESPDAEGAVADWRQAAADVTQAQASVKKAAADYDRISDLLAHKAIAQKELLAAEYELAQAKTRLDQAQAGLDHSRRRLEILGLDPLARNQMVQVRASLAGKVIDLAVTPGEYRSDISTPLMTLADLSLVWIASEVPEQMIRFVEMGEKIDVTLVAYPGEVFSARVARIADSVDPKTRTISVQAVLPNPHGKLRPEMYGTIRHTHGSRTLPTVPAGAVVRNGAETSVFIEKGKGTFHRTKVHVGASLDGMVTVLEGLQAGDRVVVNGAMLLSAIAGK